MADILTEAKPQTGWNSLLMNRLKLATINPDLFRALEAAMPLVTKSQEQSVAGPSNIPVNTMGQVQPQAIKTNVLGGTLTNLANTADQGQPVTPAPTQGQPQPQEQAQAAQGQAQTAQTNATGNILVKLINDLNADRQKKAKAIGPDLGGSGGILGTGLSPSTALMYALGALITSRLPQDKALAMTMKIGGLPGEFEKDQSDLASNKVNAILQAVNAETAQGNLQMRNVENLTKMQKEVLAGQFRDSIQPGQADLTPQQKLAGVTAGVLPASVLTESTQVIESTDDQGEAIKLLINKNTGEVVKTFKAKIPATKSTNLSVRTREILAADKEAGGKMSIGEAHQKAMQEEIAISGGKQEAGAKARYRIEAEKRIDALIDADTQIKSIFKLSDQLITAKTPGQAVIDAATLNTKAIISGTTAGTYKQTTAAMAGTLARSLGGERGVLTDRDIDRVVAMFPTFSDTLATKEFKRARLEVFMDSNFRKQQAILDGEPVDPIAERRRNAQAIDKMIEELKGVKTLPPGSSKVVTE